MTPPMVMGIDPGKEGALAIFYDNEPYLVAPLPMLTDGPDIVQFTRFLDGVEFVVIEEQMVMPRQSIVAAKTQLVAFGQLLGAVQSHLIPLMRVRPQEWKASVLKGLAWHNKKVVTRTGKTRAEKNKIAIDYVRQRFPNVSLRPTGQSTADSLDMAEAVCIAQYGLMIQDGSQQ